MKNNFKLPGTGINVQISFDPVKDLSEFTKFLANINIMRYKPSNITWKDYQNWLQDWLNNGTLDQVKETDRPDLKLLWIKMGKAKVDPNDNLINIIYGNPTANLYTLNGKISKLVNEIKNGRYPDQQHVNRAVKRNMINTLKYLASINPPILPNVHGANLAAGRNNINILNWLASMNPPIMPNVHGANLAAGKNNINILNWLALRNPPIMPNVRGANLAAGYGSVNSLQWLSERNPPILPDIEGVNWANEKGRRNVLNWLASRNPPILPNSN